MFSLYWSFSSSSTSLVCNALLLYIEIVFRTSAQLKRSPQFIHWQEPRGVTSPNSSRSSRSPHFTTRTGLLNLNLNGSFENNELECIFYRTKIVLPLVRTQWKVAYKKPVFLLSFRLRPYHPEHARSRLISEAKQGRAWLVLGWETAWEYQVL